MAVSTLKDELKNWTDFDGAMYQLAQCLGLIAWDVGFGKVKNVFWTNNAIANMLVDILRKLVENGVLEFRDEPDYQYRWNPDFKGSWEPD